MIAIRDLPSSLDKRAINDLKEDKNRMKEDIEKLREWINKQPHLRARTDDQFLVTYLRGCKYSHERAKEKIDLFLTTRSALPDYFQNRNINDPKTQELLRLGFIIPLPKTDGEDGPRIFLVRPGTYDPHKYNVQQIMKAVTLLSDYQDIEDDNLLVAGYQVIIDAKNVKGSHALQYDPVFLKKMATYYQDSCVARFKGAYILNLPTGFESLLALGKSFMTEKNKSRINMLGNDMASLIKHIPKCLLPNEYGGDSGTIAEILDSWIKKLEAHQDMLKKQEEYGTDESKRIEQSKNADGLFGTVGTFRSLSLD